MYNKNIPGLNNSIGNLGVDRINDPRDYLLILVLHYKMHRMDQF